MLIVGVQVWSDSTDPTLPAGLKVDCHIFCEPGRRKFIHHVRPPMEEVCQMLYLGALAIVKGSWLLGATLHNRLLHPCEEYPG